MVSRNGMLLSMSGYSMVSFTCASTEFRWLKKDLLGFIFSNIYTNIYDLIGQHYYTHMYMLAIIYISGDNTKLLSLHSTQTLFYWICKNCSVSIAPNRTSTVHYMYGLKQSEKPPQTSMIICI